MHIWWSIVQMTARTVLLAWIRGCAFRYALAYAGGLAGDREGLLAAGQETIQGTPRNAVFMRFDNFLHSLIKYRAGRRPLPALGAFYKLDCSSPRTHSLLGAGRFRI
jgi:hypothetical protein